MLPTIPRLSTLPRISQPFKRAQEGLFHGKTKQAGNNVPHSKHKTRRTWLPNVQSKRLTLEAVGEMVKLKVTTRAMKCIRKVRLRKVGSCYYASSDRVIQAGGLDKYLLNTRSELLGMQGMRLRSMVHFQMQEEARVAEEAQASIKQSEKLERRAAYLENTQQPNATSSTV